MVDGKVAVPVRVGFSTAEYGILTGVTVNGVTYKVETDSVPLATPGSSAVSADNSMGNSPHDVKFVLSAPIEIPR